MLNVIVAIAKNGVIGGANRLLWHISEDLRHFKEITLGHPVIMGRKTYESIGRPLPNRENVVISRSNIEIEGCRVVHSLVEAIELFSPTDQLFIIGGAEIYRAALPMADRFYITQLEESYEGDTSFPEWSGDEWECVGRVRHERGEKYEHPYTFEEYRRVAVADQSYYIGEASINDAQRIRDIARDSFFLTYQAFVSREQLDWMFEDMYSVENIRCQILEGHLYYFIYHEGKAIGYFSVQLHEGGVVHLHKLYLSPSVQGYGYGRILIEKAFDVAKRISPEGRCRFELYVNRNNKAVNFYNHMGFKVAAEGDYLIEGTEFIRTDYLLYKELK